MHIGRMACIGSFLLMAAATSQAALIKSFENTGGPAGSTYSTTIGVTDGTYSCGIPGSGAWAQPFLVNDDGTAGRILKQYPLLKVDITLLGETPGSNDWLQIGFVIQGQGLGWTQSPWLHDGAPGTAGITKKTLTWDVSSYMLSVPDTANWFQINLKNQGDPARTIYVDNLRAEAVPEPAALGVVAISAIGFLHRRRSRHA